MTGCLTAKGKAKKWALGASPAGDGCNPLKETEVTVPVLPGECGDGFKSLSEECDDGNSTPFDGCSATCQYEAASCGDMVVQQGEQCDDGNALPGDGCSATCQTEGSFVQVPFYATLDGDGAIGPIATNGPLRAFARCRVNDAGNDRIELVVVGVVDGWFEEDNPTTAQLAGAEITVNLEQAPTGTPFYDNMIDDFSAVAPGGYYVGLDGESTGLGLNLFGHDCIAVGVATMITGNP
jgi:cysteine-rich repeat protein